MANEPALFLMACSVVQNIHKSVTGKQLLSDISMLRQAEHTSIRLPQFIDQAHV